MNSTSYGKMATRPRKAGLINQPRLALKTSKMARYYGVKCRTCALNIPLIVCKPNEDRTPKLYSVPLDSIACFECGSIHMYDSDDCVFFDGPDGLLPPRSA